MKEQRCKLASLAGVLLAVGVLVMVGGCPPVVPTVDCVEDADCDDGVFCNGDETCVDGACVAGDPPCDPDMQRCDEDDDICIDLCETDEDCDDDDLCTTDACVEGECVRTLVVECEDDGLFCTGEEACDPDTGECVSGGDPCEADGLLCDEENDGCVECFEDADCAEGEVCQDGVCVEPITECETDADCAEGEVCDDGVCIEAPAVECETDADCAEGEICVLGECYEVDGLDGAALYATHCAGCHGIEGEGGIGPDIRLQSAAELTAGLESGSHAGVAELSEEEIAAMADYLGG